MAENDATLLALTDLLVHFYAMQSQMRQYVQPGGYTAFDRKRIAFENDREAQDSLFISDMIYLMDGPEQRKVEAAVAAALRAKGGTS